MVAEPCIHYPQNHSPQLQTCFYPAWVLVVRWYPRFAAQRSYGLAPWDLPKGGFGPVLFGPWEEHGSLFEGSRPRGESGEGSARRALSTDWKVGKTANGCPEAPRGFRFLTAWEKLPRWVDVTSTNHFRQRVPEYHLSL